MSVPPSPYGQNPHGGPPAGQSPGAGSEPSSTKPAIPNAMAIATELWILVIVAQCVVFGSQYKQFFDAADDVAKDNPDAQLPDGVIWTVIVVTGVGLAAVFAALTWVARIGFNWARLVLGFFSFFLVVQAVMAFFADGSDTWVMVPHVIGGVAALGAGVLLMHRDSDKYCKDMARWRKEKKRQPPSYYTTPYPQQPYHGQQYGQQQYGQPQYGPPRYDQQAPPYGGGSGYPPAGYRPPGGSDDHSPENNSSDPGDRT
ncbi:hypothetical protein [Williamsia sp.]|uniref:hypothetical protein n=1 Tax=Williamsia sp. TaxID=1872085 RepID=UPI002F955B4A